MSSRKIVFRVCNAQLRSQATHFFTAMQLHINIPISGLISIFIKCETCQIFAQQVTYELHRLIRYHAFMKLLPLTKVQWYSASKVVMQSKYVTKQSSISPNKFLVVNFHTLYTSTITSTEILTCMCNSLVADTVSLNNF